MGLSTLVRYLYKFESFDTHPVNLKDRGHNWEASTRFPPTSKTEVITWYAFAEDEPSSRSLANTYRVNSQGQHRQDMPWNCRRR